MLVSLGELFLGLFSTEKPVVCSALRDELKIPLKPELSGLAVVSWLSHPALPVHKQQHRGAPGKPAVVGHVPVGQSKQGPGVGSI